MRSESDKIWQENWGGSSLASNLTLAWDGEEDLVGRSSRLSSSTLD